MMRKAWAHCALSAGAVALLAAGTAQAQDAPRVFTQDGSWSLDYGDDYCRLAANFINGSDRVALAIERIQPGTGMRLALVGNAISTYRGADEIGLRYLPQGAERKLRYVKSEVGGGEQYLLFDNVPLADPAPIAPGMPPAPPPPYDRAAERATGKGITGFALGSGLTAPVEVRTGAMSGPIQALQTCTDDMLASWGLDAAKHQTLKKPALPAESTAGWLPAGTIPFGDFPRLGGGMNQFRMMVDATGKPTACHVHFPSLDVAKNQQICATLMEKGKFTPAEDASGQAMASYVVLSPFFLMPPPPMGRRR